MPVFGDLSLDAGGMAAWLAVGLVAGFLSGRVMAGDRYGVVGDPAAGPVGAVGGGVLAGTLVSGS